MNVRNHLLFMRICIHSKRDDGDDEEKNRRIHENLNVCAHTQACSNSSRFSYVCASQRKTKNLFFDRSIAIIARHKKNKNRTKSIHVITLYLKHSSSSCCLLFALPLRRGGCCCCYYSPILCQHASEHCIVLTVSSIFVWLKRKSWRTDTKSDERTEKTTTTATKQKHSSLLLHEIKMK